MTGPCYVDMSGKIRFVENLNPSRFKIVEEAGYTAIWILGPEIAGEREVTEEYVLHPSLEALRACLAE